MMISKETDGRDIEILMVEDNEGDARLAREALRDGRIRNALHHVWDGEEALAFLRRRGEYADAPRPDLILLDLDLPRMDGGEVLSAIKEDDEFKRIPVVILTTSSADADILRSYNRHANCYITKPINMVEFLKVVTAIQDFWLTIVTLPAMRAAG
jgi:CheY-like chemotaxis protein